MHAVAAVLLMQGAAAFSTPQRWRPPATRVAPLEGAPIHAHEVEAAIEVAVKAALHTATSAAFWEVAGAFVAGGLFFSTVAAACGAVYTYGEENVLYGFGLVRRLISRSWELFYAGLGAAKDEFLTPGVGRKRWKKAWNAVGSGVTDAKKAAQAGVEAIKAEARLQAFALGPPGLQALNHVVKQVTPFKLAAACEEAIKGACADFEHPSAKKLELKSFSMGETPPKLTAARAYDVGADAMAFDIDIKWRSELNAELEAHLKGIGGPRVPVSLRNARVEGTVRLVLTPLGSEGPGFGASLLSFAKKPEIGLDLRVAGGEVTKVPWLKANMESVLVQGLEETMLWPKRIVAPAEDDKGKHLLGADALTALATDDPLLALERKLEATRGVLKKPETAEGGLSIDLNPPEPLVVEKLSLQQQARKQMGAVRSKVSRRVALKRKGAAAEAAPNAVEEALVAAEIVADELVEAAGLAALDAFDLNGDGKVDLEDLRIAAERARAAVDEAPARAGVVGGAGQPAS